MRKSAIISKLDRVLSSLYANIDEENFMIPTKSDLIVYHYTSLEAALSIFETKCVYASDVRYLNDSKEVEYGHAIFTNEILKMITEAVDSRNDKRAQILGLQQTFYGSEDAPSYAACFCANGDLLSQWRAYGKNAGISIGFAASVLDATKFHLSKVIYDRSTQTELVRGMLDEVAKVIEGQHANLSFEQLLDCVADTTGPISSFTVPLKDPAFSEEQEYRLYISQYELERSVRVHRRAAKNFIIDFLKISFASNEWKKAIKEVIVGPSNVSELSVRNLKEFLEAIKLPNVAVKASAIPFRN